MLPCSQMGVKSVLTSNKLGLAPAADFGSSGPCGRGKAEPSSGKASASGQAASCPAVFLLPASPWATGSVEQGRLTDPSPRSPSWAAVPRMGHLLPETLPQPGNTTHLRSSREQSRMSRGWRKPPQAARALWKKRSLHPPNVPQHRTPPQFRSLTRLGCKARPPSFCVALLCFHHTHKQSRGRQEKGESLQAKVTESCSTCSG